MTTALAHTQSVKISQITNRRLQYLLTIIYKAGYTKASNVVEFTGKRLYTEGLMFSDLLELGGTPIPIETPGYLDCRMNVDLLITGLQSDRDRQNFIFALQCDLEM